MKTVTLEQIMSWNLCYEREKISDLLFQDKEEVGFEDIVTLDIPAKDKLWAVLRNEFFTDNDLYFLACKFASLVMPIWEKYYPNDKRPQTAIETRLRWLRGEATDEELAVARTAAGAADAAAREAAREAAWAAAGAATSAARAAAGAADAAAWAAAWAADAAAEAAQLQIVIDYYNAKEKLL